MATLDPEIVDALNMLLEDVRASVEIEVALSNGATEYLEREALTAMGVEDTRSAFLLRDWLESRDLPVTRRINGIVLQALDLTRYDDRLSLFLHHQLAARDQAEQLIEEADLDSAAQDILREIVDAHARHAAWSEERAREFAETRDLEFRHPAERPPGGPRQSETPGAPNTPDRPDRPDRPDESDTEDPPDPPEASGERGSPRAARQSADAEVASEFDDIEDAVTSPDNGPSAE